MATSGCQRSNQRLSRRRLTAGLAQSPGQAWKEGESRVWVRGIPWQLPGVQATAFSTALGARRQTPHGVDSRVTTFQMQSAGRHVFQRHLFQSLPYEETEAQELLTCSARWGSSPFSPGQTLHTHSSDPRDRLPVPSHHPPAYLRPQQQPCSRAGPAGPAAMPSEGESSRANGKHRLGV